MVLLVLGLVSADQLQWDQVSSEAPPMPVVTLVPGARTLPYTIGAPPPHYMCVTSNINSPQEVVRERKCDTARYRVSSVLG